jgi:hypothetical protein
MIADPSLNGGSDFTTEALAKPLLDAEHPDE